MQNEVTAYYGEYKIGGSVEVDMFNNSRLKRKKGKKIVCNFFFFTQQAFLKIKTSCW